MKCRNCEASKKDYDGYTYCDLGIDEHESELLTDDDGCKLHYKTIKKRLKQADKDLQDYYEREGI